MLERKDCGACGGAIGASEIRDGLARTIDGVLYCRPCAEERTPVPRSRKETESFLNNIKDVLGGLKLTPEETLQVDRKTRVQVTNLMENMLGEVKSHPSWGREDIVRYLRGVVEGGKPGGPQDTSGTIKK